MSGGIPEPASFNELNTLAELDCHISELRAIRNRKCEDAMSLLYEDVRTWRERIILGSSWGDAARFWRMEFAAGWCLWRIRLALRLSWIRDPRPAIQSSTARITRILAA